MEENEKREPIKNQRDAEKRAGTGYFSVEGTRGLYLSVNRTGARSWIFRYRRLGRVREMGLGSLEWVKLAQARELAAECGAQIARGVDPIDTRKAARDQEKAAHAAMRQQAVTFDKCAVDYIALQRAGWKNEKHAFEWDSSLKRYASPVFGKRPVSAIDENAVLEVLRPIWTEKTETATRLRERIERVLEWAKAKGFRTGDNPARWDAMSAHGLPNPGDLMQRSSRKQPSLPYKRMPEFMAALRRCDGLAALALEFQILTAARGAEVRGAEWGEFDLDAGLWTVPGARMKGDVEHEVPLTPRAVEIIERMKQARTCDLVFPGNKKEPMSDATLLAVIKRMNGEKKKPRPAPVWIDPKEDNAPIVAHGFRASFRTWATEARQPFDVAEMCLAHKVGDKTERSYNRADLRDDRRALLKAWADFCVGAA